MAVTAGTRNGSLVGAGHSTVMATSDAAAATAQPASRSGIDETSPGSDTGRMKASSSDVVALASTELTTPAKITQNATSAMATAASQSLREASVARQTNAPPASASAACACQRSRIVPPKSTSTSRANDPKAANVAISGFPITSFVMANRIGITIAVRAARRNAANPGSRARSHSSGEGFGALAIAGKRSICRRAVQRASRTPVARRHG